MFDNGRNDKLTPEARELIEKQIQVFKEGILNKEGKSALLDYLEKARTKG